MCPALYISLSKKKKQKTKEVEVECLKHLTLLFFPMPCLCYPEFNQKFLIFLFYKQDLNELVFLILLDILFCFSFYIMFAHLFLVTLFKGSFVRFLRLPMSP